jgi:hypothetical protein
LLKQRKIGESTLVLTPEQLEKAEEMAAKVRARRVKLDQANQARIKQDGDSAAAHAEASRKRIRAEQYQEGKAKGKKANVARDVRRKHRNSNETEDTVQALRQADVNVERLGVGAGQPKASKSDVTKQAISVATKQVWRLRKAKPQFQKKHSRIN